ncbi:hypothetical protein SB766_19335 [Pseudomonas sp. SIMBA_077]
MRDAQRRKGWKSKRWQEFVVFGFMADKKAKPVPFTGSVSQLNDF